MRWKSPRSPLPVLVVVMALALLATASPTLGAGPGPAQDASHATVGNVTFAGWVTLRGDATPVGNLTVGQNATLHLAWSATESGTYRANLSLVTAGNLQVLGNRTIATGNFTTATPASAAAATAPVQAGTAAGVPGGAMAYITVYRWVPGTPAGNGTNGTTARWAAVAQGSLTTSVNVRAAPPAATTVPWTFLGALVVVVAVGGAGYVLLQRRRRPAVEPRSRTLRELEAEETRRPRDRERAREEVATREAERRQDREARILQARLDDLERSIDLARKRLERGEITAYQFERIRERKEQELEAVRRDLEASLDD